MSEMIPKIQRRRRPAPRKRCKVCGRLITVANFPGHRCLPSGEQERDEYNDRYGRKHCDVCGGNYVLTWFPYHKCKEDKK